MILFSESLGPTNPKLYLTKTDRLPTSRKQFTSAKLIAVRILLTGASSFTGYWFAKTLSDAGHEVVATLTQQRSSYEGLRGIRVDALSKKCRFEEKCCFGDERFLSLIQSESNWDMLCHHGAVVTNYKSLDFDAVSACATNTKNLHQTLEAIRKRGCSQVVLTGSVFEQDEGAGDQPLQAFSPYGLSKGMTFQCFRFHCNNLQMKLGKFVIPNPFGPYEEPRFTHYLVNCWKKGETAIVGAPDYKRDNIHVELLAAAYLRFVEDIDGKECIGDVMTCNPSGYVESQLDFARRFAASMEIRFPFPCLVDFQTPETYPEPIIRHNTQSATEMTDDWNEDLAWDTLAKYYLCTSEA